MNTVSRLIRRFTVPPVFAAMLLTVVYISHPEYFGAFWLLPIGILFLSVLPTLAYPMQRVIPHFKNGGRKAQRTLAMIFSFLGYLGGTAVAYISEAPAKLKMIFLEYLLCGISMIVLNKLLRLKASGHACGVVGPVFMSAYLRLFAFAIVCAALIIPVYVSSVKTKQHTVSQLVIGSAIPAVNLLLLTVFFGW